VEIAKRLAVAGDRSAEAALIRLLRDDSREVRAQAATALGRAGTIAAVLPLLELAEGVLAIGRVAALARDAIAAIRARTGHTDRGQLSIRNDPHAGAVAIAPPQPGAVSYTDEETRE
jgi:HEAT repeat protein